MKAISRRKESATVDLKVRMKEPLRASLERAAKKRGVSMNAEAVARLERSFAADKILKRLDLIDGKLWWCFNAYREAEKHWVVKQ